MLRGGVPTLHVSLLGRSRNLMAKPVDRDRRVDRPISRRRGIYAANEVLIGIIDAHFLYVKQASSPGHDSQLMVPGRNGRQLEGSITLDRRSLGWPCAVAVHFY